MNYYTFEPHPDLASIIQCYWTLKVPAEYSSEKQRIIPDGTIEMAFILGDDIKRFTSEDRYIIQPRAMVLGQTIKPFYIQPTGYVDTFAIRFFPYGFANLVNIDIKDLVDTETPLANLFDQDRTHQLSEQINHATSTSDRIKIIEDFLFNQLQDPVTIDKIVKSTVEALTETKGSVPIKELLKADLSKRRQLERNFSKQIGLSPKQLGKVIRLQAALKILINREVSNLTDIAYGSKYYDQAHFIKDFKEFTGTNPKDFLSNKQMELSTLFYSED